MGGRAPVLVYDADCGFCRRWVERWRRSTGNRVRYLPYQRRAVRWRHNIRKRDAQRAAQLVERDGSRHAGATAVFRALLRAKQPWLRGLARSGLWPGARRVAEAIYRVIAAHRQGASRAERRLMRLFAGAHPEPRSSFWRWLSRPGLPARALGLIYWIAFRSLRRQVLGLYGERGILPIRAELDRGAPTLLRLDSSDRGLLRLCRIGETAGLALCAGVLPRLSAMVAWASYLSFVSVGREFLRYQWDVLLLEAGLQAMLGDRRRVLMRTLAFRLQLESGISKLASHDPTWRNLSACCYHQETQPLPTPVGWYLHHLPRRVKKLGTILTLVVECGIPFLAWLPGRFRRAAFVALTGFQGLIAATGNFAFFNWLTVVLNLSFVEAPGARRSDRGGPVRSLTRAIGGSAEGAVAGSLLALGAYDLYGRLRPRARGFAPLDRLSARLARFRAIGSYGLFAVMTTKRPEIAVEGSEDGREWREYGFRYKPGDVRRAPPWVAPHQPRLDWQLWFAALQYPRPWFAAFLTRLLEGSPDVLALLKTNPFPARPPRFVRAVLYDYQMTDLRMRRETGCWWRRERQGIYFPACALEDGRLRLVDD